MSEAAQDVWHVGYVGPPQARGACLLEGLKRLEYRGYDSAGIAVVNGPASTVVQGGGQDHEPREAARRQHAAGHVSASPTPAGRRTASPTTSTPTRTPTADGTIAADPQRHHRELRSLPKSARASAVTRFKTETDTEVLAHLIERVYTRRISRKPCAQRCEQVEGTYGIAVISPDEPDVLVGARNGSPLIVGVGDGEYFLASDAPPILRAHPPVVYLDDGEMVVLTRDGLPRPRPRHATRIEKQVNQIEWDLDTIEKGGFEHFMLKEIFEQPDTVAQRAARPPARGRGHARLGGLNLTDDDLQAHQPHHHHRLRHVVARRR